MILVCGVLGDGMVELMCSRLQSMGYEFACLSLEWERFAAEVV